MTHLMGLQLATRLSHVSCDVIQPNPGGKIFTLLAILTFSTQGFKYAAEGELSKARKAGKTNLSCTRPTPKFDLNDVKKDKDVRKEIIGYFESTLIDQGKGDWCLLTKRRNWTSPHSWSARKVPPFHSTSHEQHELLPWKEQDQDYSLWY